MSNNVLNQDFGSDDEEEDFNPGPAVESDEEPPVTSRQRGRDNAANGHADEDDEGADAEEGGEEEEEDEGEGGAGEEEEEEEEEDEEDEDAVSVSSFLSFFFSETYYCSNAAG